jgi:N utilization substance protein B
MTRTAARQIAIQLSFAAAASGGDAQEVCDSFFDREHYRTLSEENKLFTDYPDEKQLEYIRTLTALISEHREELDGYIEKYSRAGRQSASPGRRPPSCAAPCARSNIWTRCPTPPR